MQKIYFLFLIFTFLFFNFSNAQQNKSLISGPWAGNVELRTAVIWAEVNQTVKKISLNYFPTSNKKNIKSVVYKGELGNDFNPIKIEVNGLDIGTKYEYALVIDDKPISLPFNTSFTTKDLWQYRKPAPNFSFLTGSCAYFNQPMYDRPGKGYGSDSSIFETMAKTPADFHVWLGDNWYTREVDYSSPWGLNYRASHDRAQPVLQAFMASMPQYAIWDDHDYGPNDAGKSYTFKKESRDVFKKYWLNPSYGEDDKGIYSLVSYGDVDLFLLDDRTWRAEPDLPDSINNEPNKSKTFLGAQQMDWLQNALLFSKATFKIIVTGSQVLNPLNKYECMQHYPFEYNQLINFLSNQKINGVVFLTGDRHHSEVIKMKRENNYPLFDITVSPYTSGVSKVSGNELINPNRELNTLVEAQNFGKISFSGNKGERKMNVSFIGIKGEDLANWSINENDLKNK